MCSMRYEDLLSFEEVIVKGVHVNINSSGCSREEACPLPKKTAENKTAGDLGSSPYVYSTF